jgi:hypothetical protein
VTDDEIRALLADLPDADGLPRIPRGHLVKTRPSAARAAAAGTDLEALDAWVVAQGGELRTARATASTGLRPGRRVAPPPSAPQRVYILPGDALTSR